MFKPLSKKTLTRIMQIENAIKMHQNNITNLYAYSSNRLTLRETKYRRTKEDEICMRWTIQNLTEQLILLQNELATLLEYGA
jgi:hypothetical protein